MTRWLVGVALVITAAGSSRADIVYEFASATGTPTSSFVASEGGTLAIRVYIRDTSAGATQLNANGGLGTAGFRLEYGNPAGRVDVAGTASITLATAASGGPWAFSGGRAVDGSQSFASGTVLSELESGVLPDANGRVWLATVTLRALAQGQVTLRLSDPDPLAEGDTTSFAIDANGNPVVQYDPLLAQTSVTAVVTVVPEPTGLLAVAAVAGAGVRLGRRRGSGQLVRG